MRTTGPGETPDEAEPPDAAASPAEPAAAEVGDDENEPMYPPGYLQALRDEWPD